jgi:hypothetical protein
MTNPNLTENEFTADLGLDRSTGHNNHIQFVTFQNSAYFRRMEEDRGRHYVVESVC